MIVKKKKILDAYELLEKFRNQENRKEKDY